ncbi:hypothetical protein GW17_00050893 [Ensete ventricosum]|nr:hypothetical protein GW17_00050893 [Ensete ventricosum]
MTFHSPTTAFNIIATTLPSTNQTALSCIKFSSPLCSISRSSTLPSAPTKALSPVRRKGTNQGGRGNGKGWAKRKEGGGREKRGGRDDRQEREGREKRRRGRRGREREEEGKEKGKREGRSKGKEVMGKGGWTGNSEWRGRSGEGRDREAFTTPPCNELMCPSSGVASEGLRDIFMKVTNKGYL